MAIAPGQMYKRGDERRIIFRGLDGINIVAARWSDEKEDYFCDLAEMMAAKMATEEDVEGWELDENYPPKS